MIIGTFADHAQHTSQTSHCYQFRQPDQDTCAYSATHGNRPQANLLRFCQKYRRQNPQTGATDAKTPNTPLFELERINLKLAGHDQVK